MNLTLYAIRDEHRLILDGLQIDEDGVISEQSLATFRQKLATLQGPAQEVATSVAKSVREREYYAQAAKDAGKKLIENANRLQRDADERREYARLLMEAADLKKVVGPDLQLTRKLNPPRVVIGEDALVPDEYLDEPHPMVAAVVAAVRALPGNEDADAPLMLTAEELAGILASQLPAREPDKKALAKALKAGELIPGVSLEQGERLSID